MSDPQTAEQWAVEILETDLTPTQERRAFELFQSMPYTTTTLYALETWLRGDCDDLVGADMVHELMIRMAEHEAKL
jgi:hypothetical protein